MKDKQETQKRPGAKKPTQGIVSFTLPEVLTIETAAGAAAEVAALPFGPGVRLELDAGKIEHISTPGIQLMIAISNTVKSFGGSLHMSLPRAPVVEAFRDAGLKDYLDKLIAPR